VSADPRHAGEQGDPVGAAMTAGLGVITGLILVAARWGVLVTSVGIVLVLLGVAATIVVMIRLRRRGTAPTGRRR
jgi:hypothetical protein